MVTKETIDAALHAHSQWKTRLLEAIESGRSEFQVQIVKKDNECQFGKWLYGLSSAEMSSDDYQKVKALHADFHKVAGQILEMALTNKKDAARKMIESGGAYIGATGKLVIALNNWKSKL